MDKGPDRGAGPDRRAEAAARAASTSCASRAPADSTRSSRGSRAAGLECHATDDDVMRVFVPGEGGAPRRCSRWRRRRACRCGTCGRACRRSRTCSRTRWARSDADADSRSGLPAVRRRAAPRRPRVDGDREGRHRARCCAKRAFLGAAAASVDAVRRPRRADLRRRQLPAGGVPRADRRDLPRVPRQQDLFVFFITVYVGAGLDRQRSPRQRAADLPVEAADALGVHRRQAGGADGVPAAASRWVPAMLLLARAGRRSPAASRSSRANLFLFPAITVASVHRRCCWSRSAMLALSSLSKSAATSASSTPASSSSRDAIFGVLCARHRQHPRLVDLVRRQPRAGRRRRSSGVPPQLRDARGRCRCSCVLGADRALDR